MGKVQALTVAHAETLTPSFLIFKQKEASSRVAGRTVSDSSGLHAVFFCFVLVSGDKIYTGLNICFGLWVL